MNPRTYRPGQLKRVFSYLTREPEWLILGGPSNGNEAQTAVAKWPSIRVVACEPIERHLEWQRQNGFPSGPKHHLLPAALSDMVGEVNLFPAAGTAGCSVTRSGGDPLVFPCTTIDRLNEQYGPFENSVLWLDIERSELAALRGAEILLQSGKVLLINLEITLSDIWATDMIYDLLLSAGFRRVELWNVYPDSHQDEIWIP